ncbi:MAG TPA: thioredoxin-disulfide reductase, partial [Nitrospirae bacterium]|nr:thioredoxin-disulfide reductase [Nitrospirota bacterium]HEW81364.1 thioredoxin-disulfide reductase [Nitrospirota bacterium]
GFNVTTSELKKYFAKTLLVATGMTRRRLKVPGEETFQRKGVFYGNIQDMSFVYGEEVAVIGGGNSALQMVENLNNVAKKISLISTSKFTADAVVVERVSKLGNVAMFEGYNVVELVGDITLSGVSIRKVATENTVKIPAKGVFIAIGLQPNTALISHLIDLNDRGEIIINSDCSTSHAGIFAAGDVTNAFGKRIVIASGEGAKAALAARHYILKQKRKNL